MHCITGHHCCLQCVSQFFVVKHITDDDISLDQWMLSEDGKVIFNDFNNMVPLEWNFRRREYCTFWAHYPGTFKAPEVYGGGHYVTEQVDIWPLGNLIFSLLTGLKPWYYLNEESDIQETMRDHGAPYIDSRFRKRSFIERRLVDVMVKCHNLSPENRPDIFEVVELLKETKHIHESTKGKDFSLQALKRKASKKM